MMSKKNIPYKKNDILLVNTFAGPKVYIKVISKTKPGDPGHPGFEGCLTRRKDIIALKKRSVPYTGREKPSKCISFGYDFQIIKNNSN